MEMNSSMTIFIVQRNAVESKFDLLSLLQIVNFNIKTKGYSEVLKSLVQT